MPKKRFVVRLRCPVCSCSHKISTTKPHLFRTDEEFLCSRCEKLADALDDARVVLGLVDEM